MRYATITKLVQENHYYPYGALMGESTDILAANGAGSSDTNPYKFGGKELLAAQNANLGVYPARLLDFSSNTWAQSDPCCEDRHGNSPYHYCSSNPINRIDPTGTTDIICNGHDPEYLDDGNNSVVELSEQNYYELMNIGFDYNHESYKHIISTGTIRYDLQYTIKNVLSGKSFIEHSNRNCYDLAIEQNNVKVKNSGFRIDVFTYDGEVNFKEGCDYINHQLSNGKSVVVGVETGVDHKNINRLTGHFINIVGVGIEYRNGVFSNFYTYYDNATQSTKGTNLNDNKLQLITTPQGRCFYDNIGNVRIENTNRYLPYRMTEIRRNEP